MRSTPSEQDDYIPDQGQGLSKKKQLSSAKSYLIVISCGRIEDAWIRKKQRAPRRAPSEWGDYVSDRGRGVEMIGICLAE